MDSQSHILCCPAYAPLREGSNLSRDLDLVHYYQAVIQLREEKYEQRTYDFGPDDQGCKVHSANQLGHSVPGSK